MGLTVTGRSNAINEILDAAKKNTACPMEIVDVLTVGSDHPDYEKYKAMFNGVKIPAAQDCVSDEYVQALDNLEGGVTRSDVCPDKFAMAAPEMQIKQEQRPPKFRFMTEEEKAKGIAELFKDVGEAEMNQGIDRIIMDIVAAGFRCENLKRK